MDMCTLVDQLSSEFFSCKIAKVHWLKRRPTFLGIMVHSHINKSFPVELEWWMKGLCVCTTRMKYWSHCRQNQKTLTSTMTQPSPCVAEVSSTGHGLEICQEIFYIHRRNKPSVVPNYSCQTSADYSSWKLLANSGQMHILDGPG